MKWGVLFTVEHALPTKVYRWVKKNDETKTEKVFGTKLQKYNKI